MADESDGISEAFEGQLRVAVTAAGRVGEILARQREEAARRAQAESQQQARELASRFAAERQSARVELSSVYRNDWWERATPEQIGTTLATARAWGNEDPEAVRAEAHMRDELRTRYGVDVVQAGGDPQAVQAAVDAEVQRRQVESATGPDMAVAPQTTDATAEADTARLLHQVAVAERDVRDHRYGATFGPDEAERSAELTRANEAATLAETTRAELRKRHGIDLSESAGDYPATQAAVDAELLRITSETERQRSRSEEAEAALLMREADRADRQADRADERAENAPEGSEERIQAREEAQSHERAAESARAEAGPKYDSTERRKNDANKLEGKGIEKEAVAAKVHADVGNAKPATEAVKGSPATATKVKPARSAAARVQRSELGR